MSTKKRPEHDHVGTLSVGDVDELVSKVNDLQQQGERLREKLGLMKKEKDETTVDPGLGPQENQDEKIAYPPAIQGAQVEKSDEATSNKASKSPAPTKTTKGKSVENDLQAQDQPDEDPDHPSNEDPQLTEEQQALVVEYNRFLLVTAEQMFQKLKGAKQQAEEAENEKKASDASAAFEQLKYAVYRLLETINQIPGVDATFIGELAAISLETRKENADSFNISPSPKVAPFSKSRKPKEPKKGGSWLSKWNPFKRRSQPPVSEQSLVPDRERELERH